MKPSELTTLLTAAIAHRINILVVGAPGIGKSDIVYQSAAAAGADLILSHPVVQDPTDPKGLPWVVDGRATFLPFGELQRAIDARVPTVWFLDDLGQATPAVQAAYMQLLLARRVNGHAISDYVTFVAATNRRIDRAGVSGILEPVKSRFGSIVELEPDVDEWCMWAINANVRPELIAFIRFQPDLLCKFTATADLTNSPVPRTWAAADRLLKLGLPEHVQQTAIAGAVGAGASVEFGAFLRIYRSLPSVDQILINPDSVPVPQDPATLYALSGALAHRTNDQTFGRIATYVQRMVDSGRAEFGALTLKDALQRCPTVVNTPGFVRLATGELGALISGR